MAYTRLNPEYQPKGNYAETSTSGVRVVCRLDGSDCAIYYWTDYPTCRNGYRILFGGNGIQKSKIENGAYTQIWLK